MQISYQEKWLNHISINLSLKAFSLGLARFNKNIDQLSNEELIFMFNLVLEKGIYNPNNAQLFNKLLQKMLFIEDSYDSLSQIFFKSELGNYSTTHKFKKITEIYSSQHCIAK